MKTNLLKSKYAYSDNGNKYKKCTIGKKVGATVGAYSAVRGLTRKSLIGADGPVSLFTVVKESLKSLPTKADKVKTGAVVGTGLLIGSAIIVGLNTLIGSAVDGIINKTNAKKADKAAEVENKKVEITA